MYKCYIVNWNDWLGESSHIKAVFRNEKLATRYMNEWNTRSELEAKEHQEHDADYYTITTADFIT